MASIAEDLEDDLRWREEELASLRVLAMSSGSSAPRQQALLRALCALLYAHYEGFCRFAWDYYLEELEKRGVVRSQCRPEVIILSLRKQFKGVQGDLSPNGLWSFFQNELPALLEEHLTFPMKLETESNLWPNLLIRNSLAAGLPCPAAKAQSIKLKTLVSRRNQIAHGQKELIKSLAEYTAYEHAAVIVMHELAIAVLDALESQAYLAIHGAESQ